MNEVVIREWNEEDRQKAIDLILSIQRDEFNINITADDQPDLKDVTQYYKKGNGNFWVAVVADRVVGTVALIDFEPGKVALRKMFVHKDYRGSTIGLSQQLLNTVKWWCKEKDVTDIYLGTVDVLKAAQRFYDKNGFDCIEKTVLPVAFPLMPVDTIFYHLNIVESSRLDA